MAADIIYILSAGLVVALNVFLLHKIDPFFKTAKLHAFIILYWPLWVLASAPLMILGNLVILSAVTNRSRFLRMLGLLVVMSVLLFGMVLLFDISMLGNAVVQDVGLALFAAYAHLSRN